MTHTLTFEPLDVDANRAFLLAAHRETSRLTFGIAYTDEEIGRELDRERGTSVGAYLNGELVGLCDVERRGKDGREYGWAHFFYLAPNLRGRGLGAQLVEYAVRFCREQKLHKLYLRVCRQNMSAYRFYERNGFERAPELDRPGEHAFGKSIAF